MDRIIPEVYACSGTSLRVFGRLWRSGSALGGSGGAQGGPGRALGGSIDETQDMCLVESQDICLVETQDMRCVES